MIKKEKQRKKKLKRWKKINKKGIVKNKKINKKCVNKTLNKLLKIKIYNNV
jgi:hypothetical protein